MKKSRAAWIVTAVAFALSATAIVLVNKPPITECQSEAPIAEAPIAARQHWFRAVETVAQPWLGPHHVYGIFSVPIPYKRDRLYTARVMIQGSTEELSATSPETGNSYSGQAKPGHYIMRVYLPTRTALWFLLTGRFGDLRTPCYWWLVIEDRMG